MTHTIIFNIAGGAGKNIIATAVIESIKAKYPTSQIIISTPWRDVWLNNPNVSKIIDLTTTPSFYEEYVYKKNVTLLFFDPYNDTEFIYRREHIIETWCRLCGVPCITKTPRLFFSENEKEAVRKKLYSNIVDKDDVRKPLFFIQPSGGANNQPYPISWARDLPLKTAEEVVKAMNEQGYRSIHIRRKEQLPLAGTTWIDFTLREAMCSIQFSDKRLFVDSLATHVAGAFELESVILWVTNSPEVFGYSTHQHLEAFKNNQDKLEWRHNPDAYLDQYNIAGVWSEHPFMDDEIFEKEEILKYFTKKWVQNQVQ